MRWLGFDRFGIWLMRILLDIWIKLKLAPDSKNELTLDVTKPICYVLPSRSFSDAIVLDKACTLLNLPRPLNPIQPSRFEENRALVFLGRNYQSRDLSSPEGTITTWRLPRLERLIEFLKRNPEDDVQIVPINIYWGRSPVIDKTDNTFWKSVFSDTWAVPSAMRKLFMIMLHGRSTLLQFSEPISLQMLAQEGQSIEITTRKLHRILRVHFRRQREAVVGPDLSHRRIVVNQIIHSISVRNAITDEVRQNHASYRKAFRKARAYANEIASDYSYAVIRSLDHTLNWLWNQIYNGIEVYNINNLKKVANDYEVIYVPCHRSHIDYLLLSFVVYHHGLVPPHIAAGVNLNLPVLGPILRRGGAFFMRRSFKGNPLYSAVFNEYLHTILKRGFSIEYFIEGGRSRTGRLKRPRTGMLAMTARSYLRDASRPIMFVPVYIGYERLFEGSSYVNELYGQSKNKESLFSLVRSIRKLNDNFGKVHVNFGQPIAIDTIFDQQNPKWRNDIKQIPHTGSINKRIMDWLSPAVDSLAKEIIQEINASSVVNPINLVSLALLATRKHAMDEAALISQIDLYRSLLTGCPYSTSSALVNFNGLSAIKQAESMNVLYRQQHPLGDLLYLEPRNAVLLTYFRNNIIHNFVIPSLISCYCLHNTTCEASEIKSFIQNLYPFYRAEYFLFWEPEDLELIIDKWTETLIDHGLLIRINSGTDTISTPERREPAYLKLTLLCNITQQSLERHYIALALLLQNGSDTLTANQLEEQCHLMAQRLSLLFEFNAPEFFDKSLFQTFIETLGGEGLISLHDNGEISFSDSIETIYNETHQVLSQEVRQAIHQATQHQN